MATIHGGELRRFSASRYQRGAPTMSAFEGQPTASYPWGSRRARRASSTTSPGNVAPTFRGRKAVAAAPMYEQEIGQIRP